MIYDINGDALLTKAEIDALYPPVNEARAKYFGCFDKITGIGDSLMAGYTATPDVTVSSADAKTRKANWLAYLGADIGREPTNLAVGNTDTHDWRYGEANADITTANIDTNAYLIGLGVNDSRHGETIGSSSDIKSDYTTNGDSYYGNLDWIVHTLHGYNANAHIFLFTIPGPEDATRKAAINTAIRYIANLYTYVHCIDLDDKYAANYGSGSFINSNLYSGHYNPITYRLMADYIGQALDEFIYANYTLFRNVPYQL